MADGMLPTPLAAEQLLETPAPRRKRPLGVKANAEDGKVSLQILCRADGDAESCGLGDVDSVFAEYVIGQLAEIGLRAAADMPDGPLDTRSVNALIHLAAAVEPKDELECAMAAQMAAIHHLTLDAAARAMRPGATIEGRALNLSQAGKLGRTFAQMLDALGRHRGKVSTQRVIVENVTVEAGGQAVVGAVTAGVGSSGKSGVQRHATNAANQDHSRHSAEMHGEDTIRTAVHGAGREVEEALPNARRRARKRRSEGQPEPSRARPLHGGGDRDAANDQRADAPSTANRPRCLSGAQR